ncbi:MAG: hypothetical protein JW993_07370 [Sedimentisphaerales bacterium]|nr:hypothetical protein [Sedimentisphaerales bacterium]
MARIFCTLKEAAAWLGTTESRIKTMLAEGLLREFRNGENRLLRVADVRALAAVRFSDEQPCPASTPYGPIERPPADSLTQEVLAPDIPLPLTGTALLDPPARHTETAMLPDGDESESQSLFTPITPQWSPSTDSVETGRQPHTYRETGSRRAEPESYPPPPILRRSRMTRPAVRKGLWMGVMDDRPPAIIALALLIAGVASSLGAGVYFLFKFLG